MYKNQLQELAQRSCFNLPSYSCIREGPDHAPRFKASVNFNGEIFDSPNYCTTLRQAEHSAAEVALNVLSTRGPSRSLTARVLDETGIYKNLLQETAHRAGLKLPVYTTVRSGPGHVPTFTCSVQLAGMSFTGEAAKTKKQAEKNAAIAAWSSLKRNLGGTNNKEAGESSGGGDQEQQEQAVVARMLSNIRLTSKEDQHSRQLRRRPDHHHQTQARKRNVMMRDTHTPPHSHRDINVQNLQHWRLIDELLTDLVPQVSSSSNPQIKQSRFASLLPPPPPRTESKILPPEASSRLNYKSDHSSSSYYNISSTSSYKRPIIPVQLRTSQVTVEEHQRDEEEWLGIKSSIINMMSSIEKEEEDHHSSSSSPSPKPSSYLSISSSNSGMFGSSCAYNSRQFPPARSNLYSNRVAPAVQIRSVIPVCAAPPPQPQPPRAVAPSLTPLAMPRMRETTTPSTSTDSMSAALRESDRFYMTDRAEQVTTTETETETVLVIES